MGAPSKSNVEWEDVDVSDECGKCGGTGVRAKLMSGLQGQEGQSTERNLRPQPNIVGESHVTNLAAVCIFDRSARARVASLATRELIAS